MRRLNLLVPGVLCLFILAFTAAAEADDTFSALGQVVDANGNAVSGATVTIVNDAYKKVAATKTDASGNFAFDNVSTDGRLVKVLVSYTDTNGNTYTVPPEFSLWVPASGTIDINRRSTQLTDYPPSVKSSRASGQILTTGYFPPAQSPLNRNALAVALVLGVILLVGVYWLLRRML